ncbi:hypothetical protein ACLQ26_23340 [Micromonospora sp. DT43]|uniref:hypothetical protein n=1 Tax=Micromonospora sp. DT43 TaxID=3393440 RepID=UPI003CED1BC6
MDDWQVLDLYDGDPTPGDPASIQAMAADLQRRAEAARRHHTRLRPIAANSGALALRGDFAATVDRELAQLPDEAKALADAYLAGAQALSAFANELARAQTQSRAALRLATAADSQYRNLLGQFCGLTGQRTYGPGVWRGLNESYAAGQREPVFTMAVRIGQAARLCEAEREQAWTSALQAKALYQAAEARCANALRAAILLPIDAMGKRRDWKDPKTRTSPPERRPDSHLPAGDPVYHTDHSTGIGYDPMTMRNLDKIRPLDGCHDVVVHGTDKGYFVPGIIDAAGEHRDGNFTNAAQIAAAIRGNPAYRGQPVRLVSCYSGTLASGVDAVPLGRQIADELGVRVWAPTTRVGTRKWVSGTQDPLLDGNGEWKVFDVPGRSGDKR